jgi:hypothetical protein
MEVMKEFDAPEIDGIAGEGGLSAVPSKSAAAHEKEYNEFLDWSRGKNDEC